MLILTFYLTQYTYNVIFQAVIKIEVKKHFPDFCSDHAFEIWDVFYMDPRIHRDPRSGQAEELQPVTRPARPPRRAEHCLPVSSLSVRLWPDSHLHAHASPRGQSLRGVSPDWAM